MRGEKGDKGDKGDRGTAGLDGRDGESGPKGPQGPAGMQGAQGIQGAKGDKGDRGPAGATGPAGPAPEPGPLVGAGGIPTSAPTAVRVLDGGIEKPVKTLKFIGTTVSFVGRQATIDVAAGAHPDLATHDALGLATDAELTTHAGAADPHTGYVREADAQWIDLTDAGETALHSHAGGAAPTFVSIAKWGVD